MLARMWNIGERIRQLRNDRNLSQGDLEQRTGLLRCYLSRVENGHTMPSLQTLAKIARALDIPVANFFTSSQEYSFPRLSSQEISFLSQLYALTSRLKPAEREQILAIIKQMAEPDAAGTAS